MLTNEDIRSLVYFWQEKRDLERSVDWPILKPELEKEYPHLIHAWNDYKHAKIVLDMVVDKIAHELPNE